MAPKKCTKKGCNKEAISFSKFCGKHSSNRDIIKKLKHSRLTNFKSIYLDEVEIRKIKFNNKHFVSATIQDAEFMDVVFTDCTFKACIFSNTVLTSCKFVGCSFYQWDCTDITLHETIFENCLFEDWQLNQCFVGDDTAIINSTVDACNITGGFFSETGIFGQVKFLSANFVQVSFAQARFTDCQFLDVSFSKTSLYDSEFTACYFDTVSHDFSITGVPMLCDFRASRFVNMSLPTLFKRWNNLKTDPLSFYRGQAQNLTALNHPNHLPELAVVLTHLNKLNYRPDVVLIDSVRNLFIRLAKDAHSSSDYRTLGNIMSEFGKIPEEFRRNTGFYLPPPSDTEKNSKDKLSKLTITAHLEEWRLERVSRFMGLLSGMELSQAGSKPLLVDNIQQGSILVEVIGFFRDLIGLVRSLVDLKHTKIEGNLKNTELQIKMLELKKEEIEIAFLPQTKQLELEKQMLELTEKKLALIKELEKRYGFNYAEFLKNPACKKMKRAGEAIRREFPILNIKIEE
ncbi:MAG: pentapeptide repeat-containing protein [Bacteroidetes bacterium]|nr:pentapeptide repeat-containing protein [Bacteroidota bacterium]